MEFESIQQTTNKQKNKKVLCLSVAIVNITISFIYNLPNGEPI